MENELFVISSELKRMEVFSRIFEMNLLFVILNFILILEIVFMIHLIIVLFVIFVL